MRYLIRGLLELKATIRIVPHSVGVRYGLAIELAFATERNDPLQAAGDGDAGRPKLNSVLTVNMIERLIKLSG